jgi:hypothetical protein
MKDPAFLFYYRDFKSSTEGMTNSARGAYIQLMCIQAENGFITDKDMKKICSNICFDTMQVTFDADTYNSVKSKFSEIAARPGCFINERLSEEIEKRVKYSESRRSNRSKSKTTSYEKTYDSTHEKTYVQHMVNGNVNGNINEIEIEKGVQGEKQIYGQNEPRFADPVEAGFDPADHSDLTNLICKQTGTPPQEIPHRFNQYRLKCMADAVFRDRRGHVAGFTKWLVSWKDNEKKTPSRARNGQEKLAALKAEMFGS